MRLNWLYSLVPGILSIKKIPCTFSKLKKDLKGGLTGSMKDILIPLITLLVGLVIAFPAGIAYRRKVAEAELGSKKST